MHTAGRTTLAVLGAGPKGIAIAAKHAALARTGWEVPDLLLIDRAGVAANWSGAVGYTDGRQRLSTAPEKDVGFPYAHTWGADSERISHEMSRWSWQSYLVHDDGFADWVDRGRPRPNHRQWSQYLRWVAARIPVEPLLAEVERIDLADGRWRLAARTPTGERLDFDCDGLVLTGPGPPVRLPGQHDDHPRILDGRSFWTSQDALGRGGPVEVCVIGDGETAGSIASALLGVLPEGSTIELVSDHGVLYTRGESFTENRLYSDPTAAGWQRLAERHRREFVRRTDRGVFSVQVEDVLNPAEAVRAVAGRVIEGVRDARWVRTLMVTGPLARCLAPGSTWRAGCRCGAAGRRRSRRRHRAWQVGGVRGYRSPRRRGRAHWPSPAPGLYVLPPCVAAHAAGFSGGRPALQVGRSSRRLAAFRDGQVRRDLGGEGRGVIEDPQAADSRLGSIRCRLPGEVEDVAAVEHDDGAVP